MIQSFIQTGGGASGTVTHFNALIPYLTNFAVDTVIEPVLVSSTGDGAAINYTVPAGKRAMIDLYGILSTGASAESLFVEVQWGGTGSWYRVSGITTFTNGASLNPTVLVNAFSSNPPVPPIFEAGDIVAVNAANGTAYIWGVIYTFDNTSPIKSPRLSGTFNFGTYTFYTVPAGKSALLPNAITSAGNVSQSSVSGIALPNSPAVAATNQRLVYHRVASGGLDIPLGAFPFSNTLSGFSSVLGTNGDSITMDLASGAAFVLTSVANASAGSTVYTGTITGGGSNAYNGATFLISGFNTAANNGTFACTASTTTTLTLSNASGVAETRGVLAYFKVFPLTSVANASAGSTVYTGVFGVASTMIGWYVTIAGFTNSANNGTFICTANTTTTLTLSNASGASESHAATATLDHLVGAQWLNWVAEL